MRREWSENGGKLGFMVWVARAPAPAAVMQREVVAALARNLKTRRVVLIFIYSVLLVCLCWLQSPARWLVLCGGNGVAKYILQHCGHVCSPASAAGLYYYNITCFVII